MSKLKVEDLDKIKKRVNKESVLREDGYTARITVHMGTCGIASGARDIMDALMSEIEAKEVHDVIVTTSGCAGLCSREPMATVELPGKPPVKYVDLTKEKVKKIFDEHVLGGNIVTKYALAIGSERTY